MYWTFYNLGNGLMDQQDNGTIELIWETFNALVDAIIPRTMELAIEFGKIQYYGALDSNTAEYMIMTLNNYYIPLAKPTAVALNLATEQLVMEGGYNRASRVLSIPKGSKFAAIEPIDRFRALTLLEQFEDDQGELTIPIGDNPEFILSITSALTRFTMMGYYSEWSGYGSTRLEEPNRRVLEHIPISWAQVDYPGRSLGYRALRE